MENKTPGQISFNPFQNIGMALSGGGFRAASFSLGALSYLNHLTIEDTPIADRISFISSASGGTITALLYTAGLHQGKNFLSFYRNLLFNLEGDRLLEMVLKILNDDKKWNKPGAEKQRNLINAFAKVYDKMLFDQQTMAVFFQKTHRKKMEVCFNSTEFYRGLSFRFQTDGRKDGRQVIGHNYLWFDFKQLETFKKIKLADVLAASSCFPMGLEPIIYPEDFSYSDSPEQSLTTTELRAALYYENYNEEQHPLSFEPSPEAKEDSKEKGHIQSVAFMDGGITDNQGLYTLMLADNKRRKRTSPNPFDLIIVTDVASHFMHSYETLSIQNGGDWRNNNLGHYLMTIKMTLSELDLYRVLSLWGSVVLIIAACLIPNQWIRIPAIIISTILLTMCCLFRWAKRSKAGKNLLKGLNDFDLKQYLYANLNLRRNFSVSIIEKLVKYLNLTRLSVFEQMIKSRISSVMTMVSDVNLKQVRRLIFKMFYDDTRWDDRRVPNFIYELSSHNQIARESRINDKGRLKWGATEEDKQLLLEGLEQINGIAEEARSTGTTLWFDETQVKNEILKKIVATGQFTTCANLLEYIISLERKKVKFDQSWNEELDTLKSKLKADFLRFKDSPYFLFDELAENNITHTQP